jgi:hypothetical protein
VPYAKYYFRTSNFNWRMGVMALIGAGTFAGIGLYAQSTAKGPLIVAGVLVAASIPCFLSRYSLVLDLQARHVRDTSGFWPFVKTRYEFVADFHGLEITWVIGGRAGHYTLWLLANDGRRISLGDWGTWPRLNDVAQEISQATGWPVTDTTDGRNSLSALLRG